MLNYKPPARDIRMGQTPRTASVPIPLIPPPLIDIPYVTYDGILGVIETAAVIAITGAAAWVGIRTGMSQSGKALKAAGWVGGVGSALLGLLYLGGKSGYNGLISLPAVRVTPS